MAAIAEGYHLDDKSKTKERKEKMTLSLVAFSAVALTRKCRISVKSLSHKTSHLKIKKNQ